MMESGASGGADGTMLMFSHIPKTAGTTFNVLIRRYFGSSLLAARVRRDSYWSTYRYVDLVKDLRVYKNVRCISGHGIKPYEDFKEYSARQKWFTFLRDPVARFISHYVHQQTGNFHEHRMDLVSWAKQFNRRNWCVRMLAGEEDIGAAQQILREKVSFVGIVEKFDLSVEMFRQIFSLSGFDPTYKHRRTVSRDPMMRDKILQTIDDYRDIIEENTHLDRQLYDFAMAELWPRQRALLQHDDSTVKVTPHWRLGHIVNYCCWTMKDRVIYRPYLKFFG